jgi:hypothetical protein
VTLSRPRPLSTRLLSRPVWWLINVLLALALHDLTRNLVNRLERLGYNVTLEQKPHKPGAQTDIFMAEGRESRDQR